MTDKEKLDAIRAEIHRLVDVRGYDREMANDLFTFMNSLPNEPVSEDLEEAAKNHAVERYRVTRDRELAEKCKWSFKAGAKWQEEKDNEEKVLTYKHGFDDCKKQVSEDLKKELPKVWDRETLDEYAYQVAYDLSNDWMRETPTWDDVETAVKLGAKWKDEHQ